MLTFKRYLIKNVVLLMTHWSRKKTISVKTHLKQRHKFTPLSKTMTKSSVHSTKTFVNNNTFVRNNDSDNLFTCSG